MTKRISYKDENVLNAAVESLKSGGVILHATETCYGLAADIFNKDALAKVFEIKGRDANKPLNILVDSLEMAEKFGVFSDLAKELAETYWPGALTLIIQRTKELPAFLNPTEEFIGMRVSSDELSQKIVQQLKSPIISTSANLSGEKQLYSADLEIFRDNVELIDLIIDSGRIPERLPSTIVKIENSKVLIIREGELKLN